MSRVRALVDWLDERLGDRLEGLLSEHHARRLRRLGWGSVLDGDRGGFAARAPVRDGNRIDVLIDGEEALPAMRAAIEGATSSVHIANWHASPDFRLTREPGAPTLRELLTAAARRVPVRVLLWAGPPVPAFEPTRTQARATQAELARDGAVRCALDARERTLHCHHEKLMIVDGGTAFVGGMDFTALQGDRHDSREHPADRPLGWHDVTARLSGPVVADVADHFRRRWNEITGEQLPPPAVPEQAGGTTAQLIRTIPERTYEFAPRGEFTLLDGYLRALRSARRLVYLENQFLWSPEITEILIDKLRRPPDPAFRVVLLLPRRPSNGADTTRGQLARLIDADDGGRRLLGATITAHDGERSAPVYVHAKIGIVDDEWMTIGSANLNEHSLFNDTEVNVSTDDADLVRATRLRLWAEHLQRPVSDVDGDPADVVDRLWRPTAEEQAERQAAGLPPTHRLTLLPGVSRRASRLQGPLRGLLVDG
ncbi:MAG TPA: phospholipase D family protein [Actinophytocola sp.]|uniref:phospholipase D-like domain-containing protein n=1 Tax=Actinophytocola sp. TaxID=1872138 RepID=UPI002DDD965B|nr:phospholipase D family protein [Actinophytocola sp.]HEV2779980.1 phospholipase D family protein [Actinophytocola sp.]